MFANSTDRADRLAVRRGVRAAVVCFVTFGFFDLWLFSDVGVLGMWTRLAVGLLFLGLVEWQILRNHDLRLINVACATGLVVASFAWLSVAGQTRDQEHFAQFLVFGTVFVISSSLFFRFRFPVGAACSSAITLLFCLFALGAIVPASTKLIVVSYFVSFLGFSLYLSWQLAAERYVTFLNATRARLNEMAVREKGQQLARIANTDHLTGLRNRRAVVHEYGDYRERWLRYGQSIGVLLIDVDHFKAFNDHYGHQSGDHCLVDVGNALQRAAVKAGATLGRYGGEEFIAFCHVADEDALFGFSEAMREAVETLALPHSERRDGLGLVTVSIGASITRKAGSPDLDRLSGEADKALYSAKAKGRNRTHVFDPDAPLGDNEDRKIAEILTHALDQGLLSLVYQPIVDLTDGTLHALEALMRLQGPDGTSISPSVFIPVAERTGMIVEMGLWAVRTACLEALSTGIADRVSVNVSPVQLRAPGFPLYIAGLLGELGLQPSALALEITESVDIASDTQILQTILGLKALGVQIWLDDFGTGYAGLAWLHTIDFDVVKIDRCFLHRSDTVDGAQFIQDILRLLRNRDVAIVVEGVEIEEHLAFLQENDVRLAQGYFLCRPMPAERVSKIGPLRRYRD